ncbi:MAG: hypothetical protein RLZZ626_761 [Actinomycetota bacterium]
MSNPVNFKYEEPKGSGPGCAKLFGFGCLGLLGLGTIVTFASFGRINDVIWIVAAIALVVFLVVRSRRSLANTNANQPQAPQSPATQANYYTAPQGSVAQPTFNGMPPQTYGTPSPSGAKYGNPLCQHRFTDEQLAESEALVCACGNYFESADIKKYQKLFDQRVAVNDKIQILQNEMRVKQQEAASQPAPAAVAPVASAAKKAKAATTTASAPVVAAQEWKPTTTIASPSATPAAPTKPTFKKPKVTFSLQQWLIIGASLLVLVAGSSFVIQYEGKMNEWGFMAVTGGLAFAAGFGAFRMRKSSAVVATFLAAFTSSMQLATLWNVGALLSQPLPAKDFNWKTQPGWWWAIELFIVAIAAVFLAKATRLSGFKAIALLGLAASAVTLELGPVLDNLRSADPEWALLNLSIVAVTAVVTLYGSKVLRSIPAAEIPNDEYRDYYEDLAVRQDNALFTAARFATLLQLLAGVGATIGAGTGSGIFNQPPHLAAILILVAVAVGVSITAKQWAHQLFDQDEAHTRIVAVANGTVFIALAAAVMRATGLVENIWISEPLALIAILAIVWFSPLAKSLKPSINLLTAMIWSSAGLWYLWNLQNLQHTEDWQTPVGWFMLAFSVILTLADYRLETSRNTWPSIVVNGIGLIALASSSLFGQAPSASHTLTVLALALAANLPLALRWLLQGRKQEATETITAWIAFGVTAVIVLLASVSTVPTDSTLNDALLYAVAFMAYSVATQVLALRGPLAGKANAILAGHHYLGQAVVAVVGLQLRYSPTVSVTALTLTELLVGLIAINYGFGAVNRMASKLQVGFVLTLAAFFLNMWDVQASSLVTVYALQLAFVAAVTAGHVWALNRRTETEPAVKTGTALVAIAGSFAIGLAAQHTTWQAATNQDTFMVLGLLAVVSLASLALSKVKRSGKASAFSSEETLRVLSIGYAAFGLVTIGEYVTQVQTIDVRWYVISALALFSLIARLNGSTVGKRASGALFLLSNLAISAIAATLTQVPGLQASSPEPYTVWLSVGLIASVLLHKDAFEGASKALLIDTPILGTAFVSLVFGTLQTDGAVSVVDDYRRILASALITAFALIRLRRGANEGWLAISYLSFAALAASSAFTISSGLPQFNGPEIYSLLIAGSISATTLIAKDAAGKVRQWLLFEVPAILVAALSLGYGLVGRDDSLADLRRILGAGLIAAIVLVRLRKNPTRGTIALGYLSTVGTALAIAATVNNRLAQSFEGPEIYSLLAALAVLGVHRMALQHLELKSSLFSWGLPIGIALLPSTFWTYTSWGTSFTNLQPDQIAREIIVLVVSAVLLTFGLLKGNLANASMGIAGLTLLVVPAVASQSSEDFAVTNTALAAGLALAGILGIAKMAGKAKGNSLVYFGIPITIALAPSVVVSLQTLGGGHPVDWWRFSILITVSMVMLVLGTMREVAGLFYPGLVGLLITALPAGFTQAGRTPAFLWVLLLVLAGVMVWLAMRLEKMRKEGRTSSQWLRELK